MSAETLTASPELLLAEDPEIHDGQKSTRARFEEWCRKAGAGVEILADYAGNTLEHGMRVGGNVAGRTVNATGKGIWQAIRGVFGRRLTK